MKNFRDKMYLIFKFMAKFIILDHHYQVTINRSQGQTLNQISIYLSQAQLYIYCLIKNYFISMTIIKMNCQTKNIKVSNNKYCKCNLYYFNIT